MKPLPDPAFTPMTPGAPRSAGNNDFQVTLLSKESAPNGFHPIGHAPAAAAQGASLEPRVTVDRDGDRVSVIRIQCSCGHTIELACQYDAPAVAVGNIPAAMKASEMPPRPAAASATAS